MHRIKIYSEELFESMKKDLEDDYQYCTRQKLELKAKEEELQVYKETYIKSLTEYRINSVNRVLEYIRLKKITDGEYLEILIKHCQEKLAGKIDGVELDLKESDEE